MSGAVVSGRMALLLLTALLTTSSAALGGDREFDPIVKAIQSHYGTQPTHIPMMGLARFVVKTAHPEGVGDFRIATFEDLHTSLSADEREERDRFMQSATGGRLHPLVQVFSRRDAEATYIYVGDVGKSTEVLVATFERNEATVMDAKVSMDVLAKALKDADHMGSMLGGSNREE
jgi:hypothetical protein